jgi:hypothetical protein
MLENQCLWDWNLIILKLSWVPVKKYWWGLVLAIYKKWISSSDLLFCCESCKYIRLIWSVNLYKFRFTNILDYINLKGNETRGFKIVMIVLILKEFHMVVFWPLIWLARCNKLDYRDLFLSDIFLYLLYTFYYVIFLRYRFLLAISLCVCMSRISFNLVLFGKM